MDYSSLNVCEMGQSNQYLSVLWFWKITSGLELFKSDVVTKDGGFRVKITVEYA